VVVTGLQPAGAKQELDFLRDVKPILAEKCLECHGLADAEGGVRLDSRNAALADIDGYAAVVPGDREESELWFRITAKRDSERMPPADHGKPLTADEIETLGRWIDEGAPWQEHWGFTDWAPERHATPRVRNEAWLQSPIDAYILAQLEEAELQPAAEIDDATWLRRAYFDLIGLPPSLDEQQAFEALPPETRREQTVDVLLASPHFGEKWARHLLDLVRYAETRGHEFDYIIPNAWEYRDYLVRALNTNVGWDQLVREHIAGDLLESPRTNPSEGWNESILGTGFWFLGEAAHSPVDLELDLADRLANQIDVFGKAFLGLTVACARCHDHKFDPITARDYYALTGFVQSASYRLVRYQSLEANERVAERLRALDQESKDELRDVTPAWLNAWMQVGLAHAAQADEIRPHLASLRQHQPLADFEQGLPEGWQIEGAAFAETLPANTAKNDALQGRLTSPPFEIQHDALSFKVGGGNHPERCCVNLYVDEQLIYSVTGANAVQQRDVLWRLDQHRGKSARIEIVDQESGGWGHITAKQFALQNLVDESALVRDAFGDAAEIPVRGWLAHSAFPADAPLLPSTTTLSFAEDVAVLWQADHEQPWWQDGSSFSLREPGWVHSAQVARPIAFLPWPAVVQDPDTIKLKTAAPSREEALSKIDWRGSGRTFRTSTVRLAKGETWYLLRGKGVAFAPIEHHRVLAGPLHQATAMRFDTQNEWRWVKHAGISDYAGMRAHFEFSPLPDLREPLAVAAVVQCPPGTPLPQVPTASLTERLLLKPSMLGVAPALPSALQGYYSQRASIADQHQVESRLAPALLDGNGHDQPLLYRGETGSPREPAPRAFLSRFDDQALAPPNTLGRKTSGRLQLADQLLQSAEPLVARVFVNRVWHHMFGRGLAPQPDNFGVLAGYPTHPALLDRLARDFVDGGWQLKPLVRELVLSASYAQSSAADPRATEIDPQNQMWHSRPEKRLDAEGVRDSLLAVCGELDRSVGGPSVPVHLTPSMKGRGRPGESGPLDGANRRTIYQEIRRNFLPPFLMVFDYPTPATTMGRRSRSNVPAQSLALMNDPFVREMTTRWAKEVEALPEDRNLRLEHVWRQAFCRSPSQAELALASRALHDPDFGGWPQLLHAVLNMKEFVYVR